MNALKIIKRTGQVTIALGLCWLYSPLLIQGIFAADPDAGDVIEGAAWHVDGSADKVTQAAQFVGNIDKSRREVAERNQEKADEKAYEEAERKRDEMRRFNSGDYEDE